ncbi:hypothetical protein KAR91_43185 [Candidatus Pacearchaeota archaeon]|nr:hypothetical protein [Candidatus Pacearchaeota archaeon]
MMNGIIMMEFEGQYTDKLEPEHKLTDDAGFRLEREELRRAGIDAKQMMVMPVLYNYGVPRDYRHLNNNDRKR